MIKYPQILLNPIIIASSDKQHLQQQQQQDFALKPLLSSSDKGRVNNFLASALLPMTPLYRELSKYVQKDPIASETGSAGNARHDYLGEPAQIPFSDVYIKEEFCNIDNREREKPKTAN